LQLIKLAVEQKISRHQTNQTERQGAKKVEEEKSGKKGEEVGNQKRRLARSKAIETSCVCWRLGFKFDFGREIKRATEIYSGEW